jgi:hypothetical protein
VTRRARILPGPRCGAPDDCAVKGVDHAPEPGARRVWTYHDVQCQIPNPRPVADPDPAGPVQCTLPGYLDGYGECSLIDLHAGDHDYVRHAAEVTVKEPEIEAGL